MRTEVKMAMMTRFKAVITVLVWFALFNESRAFSSRRGLATRRTLKNDCDCKLPVGLKTRHRRRKVLFYRKTPDLSATNKNEVDQSGKESFQISDKLLGTLVLLTVPLSWGTYVPVVRYLYAIQPPVPGFVFSACYYALAAITTTALAVWQSSKKSSDEVDQPIISDKPAVPFMAGIELGSYLFIANCLQITGLRTVESDRAGFLVQLTTVMVPFVEALFAGNLLTVPVRTWFACVFAFVGLFVMGLDGKAALLNDPFSAFFAALSSFTQGDFLIMGSAVLYTLHVVRLGAYARETTPMKLAASKATVETIYSILLVFGLVSLAPLAGNQSGLLGFAAETGKEIVTFFSSFASGLASGSIPKSALLSASGAVLWTGWVTCAYTIYAQSFGQSRVRYVDRIFFRTCFWLFKLLSNLLLISKPDKCKFDLYFSANLYGIVCLVVVG
jgi:hypothetical protein